MEKYGIIVSREAETVIRHHGREAFPNECCGFLYGKEDKERIVLLAIPVANNKEGDQKRRFEISPFDYMKAEQYALKNNLQLLGVYHSHPNHPAIASKHDLAVAMPYFSYVIVSVMDGEAVGLKSWRLTEAPEKSFQEEAIKTEHEFILSSRV